MKSVDFDRFIEGLKILNNQNVPYIVSYDGYTGTTRHGQDLPESLKLFHLMIDAGTSSQSTLLGRNERTIESLYLSSALLSRLKDDRIILKIKSPEQATLEEFV